MPTCPHGHGEMVHPVGDPLEPAEPYCAECGHISGRGCSDGCDWAVVLDIKGLARVLGKSPSEHDYREHGKFTDTQAWRDHGSWNAALKKAGLEINQERTIRLPGEQLWELYYERGMSMTEIADELDIAVGTVQKELKRHDIPASKSSTIRKAVAHGEWEAETSISRAAEFRWGLIEKEGKYEWHPEYMHDQELRGQLEEYV